MKIESNQVAHAVEVYLGSEPEVQQSLRIKQVDTIQNRIISGTLKFETPLQFAMYVWQHPPAEVVVDVVAYIDQFVLCQAIVYRNHPMADHLVARGNHHEHPRVGQQHQFDLIECPILARNCSRDAELTRQLRQ